MLFIPRQALKTCDVEMVDFERQHDEEISDAPAEDDDDGEEEVSEYCVVNDNPECLFWKLNL